MSAAPMVVVVGAGVAGTGAALAAASAGARVTLVDGGAGASALWTGAVDAPEDGGEPTEVASEIALALGVVLDPGAVVPTSGWLRPAAGRDAAILDVRPLLARGEVGVVRADRPGWDADAIARAAGGGLVPVDASILRMTDERLVPDADFAARHDERARLEWLGARLCEATTRTRRPLRGLLLPPSLGVEQARAQELSAIVGVPCGEATGTPGGPPGLRFERARDAALVAAGVDVVAGRATSIDASGGRWRVQLEERALDADVVILAAGGLIGGGLEYQPSETMPAAAMPPGARPAFRCTIASQARVGVQGKPLLVPGSLFGVAPEAIAWPLADAHDRMMDRVGLLCDAEGRAAPRLYAAGEIVADARRTWLAALEGGARAGLAAARDAVKAPAARPSSPAEAPASRP